MRRRRILTVGASLAVLTATILVVGPAAASALDPVIGVRAGQNTATTAS